MAEPNRITTFHVFLKEEIEQNGTKDAGQAEEKEPDEQQSEFLEVACAPLEVAGAPLEVAGAQTPWAKMDAERCEATVGNGMHSISQSEPGKHLEHQELTSTPNTLMKGPQSPMKASREASSTGSKDALYRPDRRFDFTY